MSRAVTVVTWIQLVTLVPYMVWFFRFIFGPRDRLFYRFLWVVPTQLISSAVIEWVNNDSFFFKFLGVTCAAWSIYIYRKHKDDDDNDHWWGKKLSRVKMKVVNLGHRLVIMPEPVPISS